MHNHANRLVTYPKGDPRQSPKQSSFYFRHLKMVILVSLSSAFIFSYIIGTQFMEYKHINIDPVGPNLNRYVKQSDGPYTITYSTTGPKFSSFHMDCPPVGVYPDFGPFYNCVRLGYDGKPGTVELSVPAGLLSELPWIDRVEVFPAVWVPFELADQNKFYRWYRIEVPSGYDNISLIGGTKTEFPYSFLLALGIFGLGLFMFSSFLLWLVLEKLPKRIAVTKQGNKFRKKIHDI